MCKALQGTKQHARNILKITLAHISRFGGVGWKQAKAAPVGASCAKMCQVKRHLGTSSPSRRRMALTHDKVH